MHVKLPFRARLALPPLRPAVALVLTALVVGMSVKYAAKISKPAETGRQTRSAFLRWRGMIQELFAGGNPYVGANEYPNPPVMAVVLKPFADLPPTAGALAWFYAKVGMAVLAAVWVFRLVGGADKTPPPNPLPYEGRGDKTGAAGLVPPLPVGEGVRGRGFWLYLAVALTLPPILGDLSHGNVNVFILFLVAGCLEAYRRGWDGVAGVVLGLAVACKVTPLLVVAYFAWKRAWGVLAGCAIGLGLWLAVVPGLAFGFDRNPELLTDWYKLMVRPSVVENRVTSEHPNQSLPGVVYRLLTRSPSFVEYPDNLPTPAEYHNLADIGTGAARWMVKGCLVAFGLAVVLLCRAPRNERQGWRVAAECSLVVLGMLLFSERTWKHHAVTLLLPFAVLSYALFARDLGRGMRAFVVGVLVASALLMNVPGLLPERAADLAMVYGTHAAAFLLLAAAVCGLLAQSPTPTAGPGSSSP